MLSTVPPADSCTDQVTAVDWPPVVPVTVALKTTVPPAFVVAVAGAMETAMLGITVTVALACFELSATLVATTWKVPGVPGAV